MFSVGKCKCVYFNTYVVLNFQKHMNLISVRIRRYASNDNTVMNTASIIPPICRKIWIM